MPRSARRNNVLVGFMVDPPVTIRTPEEVRRVEEERKKNPPKHKERPPPAAIPKLSRQALIEKSGLQRVMLDGAPVLKRGYVHQNMHFSSKPLSVLKPIRLKKMKSNQRYTDRYLLCRIVTPPYSILSTRILVEDQNGWIIPLEVYNFPYTNKMRNHELDTLFPVNTVLAVREPYPKQATKGSESVWIDVYSPSDLVFLEPNDPIVVNISWKTGDRPIPQMTRSDAEWKLLGNQHFKSEEYYAAVIAYTFGLRRNPSFIVLHLNRALAYLRLGKYTAAYADCKDALAAADIGEDTRCKALYRAAQALYGQGDYIGALERYKECIPENGEFEDAEAGIERCRKRMEEKDTGNYDWISLWNNGLVPGTRFDVAEYEGPIKVVPMEGRGGGRGVVATRDIKLGELLLVSKAFVAAYREDYPARSRWSTVDADTEEDLPGMLYQAIEETIAKIYGAPHLASEVLDLYAGKGFSPVGADLLKDANLEDHNNPLAFPIDIDVSRLEEILDINCIPISLDPDVVREGPPTSLFILPAYFNHSCIPNTQCSCYGDIMFIHAARDIPKGQETMTTLCFNASYEKRQKALSRHFEQCDCPLCEADRADGLEVCSKRDQLIKAAEKTDLTGRSYDEIQKLVEEMEKTYTQPRNTVSPGLAYAYLQLAVALMGCSMVERCPDSLKLDGVNAGISNLEASGVVVTEKGTDYVAKKAKLKLPIAENSMHDNPRQGSIVCYSIAMIFHSLKNPGRAKMWVYASVWMEDTVCSGGIQLYRARHRNFPAEIKPYLDDLEILGPWSTLPVD